MPEDTVASRLTRGCALWVVLAWSTAACGEPLSSHSSPDTQIDPGSASEDSGASAGHTLADAGGEPPTPALDASDADMEPVPDAAVPPADGGASGVGVIPPSSTGHPRQFILADQNLGKIIYVNLDDPSERKGWDLKVAGIGLDLQLIGNGRLLASTRDGYSEIDLASHSVVRTVHGRDGVKSARRLPNGNTLLIGSGLKVGTGVLAIEVDANDQVKGKWALPGVSGNRLIRRTATGTFLVGTRQEATPGKDAIVEIGLDGKELGRFPVNAQPAFMAVRMPNGDTIASTGHGESLMIFDTTGKLVQTMGGLRAPEAKETNLHHLSQFQVLSNGHIVVTNSQGHGTNADGSPKELGAIGRQVIEYDQAGKYVWSWDQDPTRISSVNSVIVLDGLDLNRLHDDMHGVLGPVP